MQPKEINALKFAEISFKDKVNFFCENFMLFRIVAYLLLAFCNYNKYFDS